MSAVRAPFLLQAHIEPETLARYVDGRDTGGADLGHLAACELCRARASDARLLRALIAGGQDRAGITNVPLDATTLAGYHDQALASDQMAAVDRRMLRDDAALLELIELRLGLNGARRAAAPDAQLVARAAAAFASQSPQSQRVASLGTLIVDRDATAPVFHFHAATPEKIAGAPVPGTSQPGNGSGSYPAPAARRELALHAGRHTLRIRITESARLEFFVFDEQHFRPANGVQVSCEPDDGTPTLRSTNQAGFAAVDLPASHARLRIDAGDRWLIELR